MTSLDIFSNWKKNAVEMILAILKYMIIKNKIPRIWKTGQTILIYKEGEDSPNNWRPITLTSII
jgi:hypothetical protein